MIKKEYENKLSMTKTEVEYDEKVFSICSLDNMRVSGKVSGINHFGVFAADSNFRINSFEGDIGFIKQVNIDDKIHLFVSEMGTKRWLTDYIYVEKSYYLVRNGFEEIPSIELKDIILPNNSFIVKRNDTLYAIYAPKGIVGSYIDITYDEQICESIGKTTIMVSERLFSKNKLVSDVITYGIDPVTFKINTKIYSELQQRFIDVYSQDRVDNFPIRITDSVDELTKNLEITYYLDEIEKHFQEEYKNLLYSNAERKILNRKFIDSIK